jgi:predicted nuclease with RNAse H fold
MQATSHSYIGIDPTAGRQPFTFAALDQDLHLIALASGNIESVLAFLTDHPAFIVAVNGPPRPNQGLVRKDLERRNLPPGQLRGSDMRQAEYELREHGISVSPTPSRVGSCPVWMQMGFDLYRQLEQVGYRQYAAELNSPRWLETHPQAAFCALLGKTPLPKPTLEGRLQRQIALYEKGMGIKDPMEFFEEITRHRLLHGILPMELVYAAEELDALMAAYMAFYMPNCPHETMLVGDAREGQIALPVAGLQEHYGQVR